MSTCLPTHPSLERDFPYAPTLPPGLYTFVGPAGEVLGYAGAAAVAALNAAPELAGPGFGVDERRREVRAFFSSASYSSSSSFSQEQKQEQEKEQEKEKVTAAVDAAMRRWRAEGTFAVLRGWRDERWPVYGSGGGDGDDDDGRMLFSVERAATGVLGVMRYGVHMTGYVRDASAPHGLRIWVPRRAADKSTYPGMLDNTVAGGLVAGEDPFEAMVREADEEASLPADLMRRRCRYRGMVTYISVTDARAGGESGLVYPEAQWVYDAELPAPATITPRPRDGEVAAFYLWSVDEVRAALARGEFKPNTALVMLDFFVRHGILTREDEPDDYDEIVARMHRKLPFPGPHQSPPPVTE
ncbi:NUDIX domain-containing protein [Xylariaceae sp. FL0804]|nr:NUDIX domain-containing protein [Xylariaceae sp. FL0804]